MITHKEYYDALTLVRKYRDQVMKDAKEVEDDSYLILESVDNMKRFEEVTPDTLIDRAHMYLRLYNAIRKALWDKDLHNKNNPCEWKVSRLSEISLMDFSRQRNVGKKTIRELTDLCQCAKITLKP